MKSIVLWQIILFWIQGVAINAFVPLTTSPLKRCIAYSTADEDDADAPAAVEYSDEEVKEMRELIFSLSQEPTDHDRRTRLKEVFHEALDRPNGMPKRFTDLFGMLLTKIGEEVQMEAKKKYFEAQEKQSVEEESSDDTDDKVSNDDQEEIPKTERTKTKEELQLWALVDMMVQSKTIVKKANGELGSKGTFQ